MGKQKVKNKDLRLARQIRRLRKRLDFTQEELAEKTHLSTTFIGLLETARRKPSLKSLQKIASVLKVKTKELIPF